MAQPKEWTTAQVCTVLRVERVILQMLIKRLRIRPKQVIRAGRKMNIFNPHQVDRLRNLFEGG